MVVDVMLDNDDKSMISTEVRVPEQATSAGGRQWQSEPMSGMPRVIVGIGPVSEAEVVAVARAGAGVALSTEARSAMEKSREIVDALAHDIAPHYGISTGFGALATTSIPRNRRAALQRS